MNQRGLPPILAKIRATKEAEIEALLRATPLSTLARMAAERLDAHPPRDFVEAVAAPEAIPNIIAEVKKASPSKGVIREDFDPAKIASAYRRGGAAAISCLTDETYFQGHISYLLEVRLAGMLPVLRKDFILHRAQILQAAAAGADAILLIARMLDARALKELHTAATDLGLGVLVEVHDEADIDRAMQASPRLIGVNNRDLDTFLVDIETTYRLRELVPAYLPLVSESGIETHEHLLALAHHRVAAVLVGEHLMRQPDPREALRALRGKS